MYNVQPLSLDPQSVNWWDFFKCITLLQRETNTFRLVKERKKKEGKAERWREQRKTKGQDGLKGRRRCWSQQHKVSPQMDREGVTSGSWRIFFRSSSITSWRCKCNYGPGCSHRPTQRHRLCSALPTYMTHSQPKVESSSGSLPLSPSLSLYFFDSFTTPMTLTVLT